MDPTPDTFRALARSSPWRWSRLHLRHASDTWPDVEAWVVRPGWTLVRERGRPERVETGVPYSVGGVTVYVPAGAPQPPPPAPRAPRAPGDVVPTYRSDGLVAERPIDPDVDYDDPMVTNFTWVAMLDPVELSHHVDVSGLRAERRRGRETWSAYLVPRLGYAPRCGGNCCDLLWSEAGLRADFPDAEHPPRRPGVVYPAGFHVSLDVETGVVVSLAPDGGNVEGLGFTTVIVAVDDDVVVPGPHVPRAVRGSAS